MGIDIENKRYFLDLIVKDVFEDVKYIKQAVELHETKYLYPLQRTIDKIIWKLSEITKIKYEILEHKNLSTED